MTNRGVYMRVQPGSFIGGALAHNKEWEPVTTEVVCDLVKKNDNVVDCGAHIGYFTCLMASLGAQVIAFEPHPVLFSLLTENKNENLYRNVEAWNIAVADHDGQEELYLPSVFDDGWGSLRHSDLGDKAPRYMVAVRRLETFLNPKWRFKLLKADIEGAEHLMLLGLGDRLRDFEYLILEMNDERLKYFDTTSDKIQLFLLNQGFHRVRRLDNDNQLFSREAR